jgi:hypothetical protein
MRSCNGMSVNAVHKDVYTRINYNTYSEMTFSSCPTNLPNVIFPKTHKDGIDEVRSENTRITITPCIKKCKKIKDSFSLHHM